MKTINVTFSEEEIGILNTVKNGDSWHDAILLWGKAYRREG